MIKLGKLEAARSAFDEQVKLATSAWNSRQPPTKGDVLNWFLAAFPIASADDVADLGNDLRLVLH